MVGTARIKQVSSGAYVPFNRLTVTQTWGREIPTINFVTRRTTSLADQDELEIYRDGTLLMKCVSEVLDASPSSRTFSGRISPTLPLFRVLQPERFETDPAWLLRLLNQPVKTRLMPHEYWREEEFRSLSDVQVNWKVRGPDFSEQVIHDGPIYPDLVTIYGGMTTDNEDTGIGKICMTHFTGVNGAHLVCTNPNIYGLGAKRAMIITAKVKLSKVTNNRLCLGLWNQLAPALMVGYFVDIDLDSTTNNLTIRRAATPGAFTDLTSASIDLSRYFDQWIGVKFAYWPFSTSPNRYYLRGSVFDANTLLRQTSNVEDNTYDPFYGSVGIRGSGVAGGAPHLHVDRACVMFTQQLPDSYWESISGVTEVYPWLLTYGGNERMAPATGFADLFDGSLYTYGSMPQTLNYSCTVDFGATKTNIVRIDLLNKVGKYIQNFAIKVSTDGTSYSTVFSRTANTIGDVYAVFPPVDARYVRIEISAAGTWDWYVNDIRIYQQDVGALFNIGTINDYGAEVIFDQNWGTIWNAIHDVSDSTGWHSWINPRSLELNFQATRGIDLSGTIKFEEGRNVSTYRANRNLLEKIDRVYVLGALAGEEQLYAKSEVASLPSNYRERVFIAKSITSKSVLQTIADVLLNVLSSALEQINLTIKDGYATASWDVGDLITVTLPTNGVSGKYRVLKVSRTFTGNTESANVDVGSQGVIALKTLESILAQDTITAQLLLRSKVHDLETFLS
jgi:hypothetical protein